MPVLGGGSGPGVVYDKEKGTRTYMNVTRFDVGVGLGAGRYRVLIVFHDPEVLGQFQSGAWKSSLGAESTVGSTGAAAVTPVEGLKVHFLGETAVAATTTVRLVRLSVNTELTDAGVAAVSLPVTGYGDRERQGTDAPRQWNRALPFLAQKVIDEGYDLPLPYGVGLTFAKVDQAQLLTNLHVGINGRDEEPFEFVEFQNAFSESESLQLKLDAWLFPFMNVFAMVGDFDGEAPLDVILDGNGMLDHLGITCGTPPPPQNPLCNVLADQEFTLPIRTNFAGKTYGIGTTLAGGWKGWFVALPFNLTYADMDATDTEGISITFTPRFGRLIGLRRWGNLALFVGGNYLKTELEASGSVSTPDGLIVIEYTLDQENKDKWNLLLGGNWGLNKHWSVVVEYNGFIGSRDAFVASASFSF